MEDRLNVYFTDTPYEDTDLEGSILGKYDINLRSVHAETEDQLIEMCKDANILINLVVRIGKKAIDSIPNLYAVVRMGVGYDNVDLEYATSKGILVANIPQYGQNEVSEHAVSLILACWRKISSYDYKVKSGVWDWKVGRPIDPMNGKTLGFIGFGRIARKVKVLLAGFHLRFFAYDPYLSPEQAAEAGVEKTNIDTLLKLSDIVSIHAPLTKDTRSLINRKRVELMKGCVFVNTSRGSIVSNDAILYGLQTGKIINAALDVMEDEPNSWKLFKDFSNVIMTPHVGWYSEDSIVDLRTKITNATVEFIQRRLPPSTLNPEAAKFSKFFCNVCRS